MYNDVRARYGVFKGSSAVWRSPLTTDFGGYCVRVTPVPIPNTEVKPNCADGTWVDSPWESRSPPDFSRGGPASAGPPFTFSALIVVISDARGPTSTT